ncbi:MAG: glucose 1-dehydrogenase [Chloracidobacterium sp.]|nr:glucose 1-dehydrogenase [Chloracidobacterium sp.]
MNNRIAIVTGATSGIGRATALRFAREGIGVFAVGRNETELSRLSDECSDLAGEVRAFRADLSDRSQTEGLAAAAVEEFGRLDILVNAAGIIKNGSIETTSLEDWDSMLNINLDSVFHLTQKCVPFLVESKGNIVNVSSVTGLRAFPNVLAYCVSKAAIDQFTRCVSLELGPAGVRVNAVNPGVVVTNLHKRGGMSDEAYEKFLDNAGNTHPIGRAGTPEEVAELIAFLASDQASWITGVTYSIDGGRAQTCAR